MADLVMMMPVADAVLVVMGMCDGRGDRRKCTRQCDGDGAGD